MSALRTLSLRPTITVDNTTRSIGVGTPAPLGRNRVLSALPMNKSKVVVLQPARVLSSNFLLADPQGNVLGTANKVVVHRMLYATRTINTRRL